MKKITKELMALKDYMVINIYTCVLWYTGAYIWWMLAAALDIIRIRGANGFISLVDLFPQLIDLFAKNWWFFWGLVLIVSIIQWISDKFIFIIRDSEHGMQRKAFSIYYVCSEQVGTLLFFIILLELNVRFGILGKTTKVFAVFFFITAFASVFRRKSAMKYKEKILLENKDKKKMLCVCVVTSDFIAQSKHEDDFWSWMEKQEGFKLSTSHGQNVAWTEEYIYCSYWLYRFVCKKYPEYKPQRVLIVDDGKYGAFAKPYLSKIIEESLSSQKAVFYYNMKEKSNNKLVHLYPIHVVSDEKKILQVLTTEDINWEIPFRKKESFVLDYTTDYRKFLKYKYVNRQLRYIEEKDLDETAMFYQLIKIVEYTWHYRALYAISASGNKDRVFLDGSVQSSIGRWNALQKREDITYREEKIVEAYRLVKFVLTGKTCAMKKVRYIDICEVIAQLRNRYIGHGTMAFSVSKELLDAVAELVYLVLLIFYEDDDVLDETLMLKEGVPYMKIYRDEYNVLVQELLAGHVKGDQELYEYLDYVYGRFTAEEVSYQMDYVEEVK